MNARVEEEATLVEAHYGPTSVGPDGRWIRLETVDLVSGWNQQTTQILVEIPEGYPTVPPDNFYTSASLRLADGRVPSNTMGTKTFADEEWLGFSHHAEAGTWKPHSDLTQSHTLVDYIEGVLDRLRECS